MQRIKELVLIDRLKHMALDYSEHQITEEEIRKYDITPEFWQHIRNQIAKHELISLQIIGQVVEGKSTLGITIQTEINKLLGKEMDLQYICADQYIFYRKTMDETLKDVCLLIDEFAALEETGLNSTLEARYLDNFNAVCAQTFIHKIACSPKRVFDQQSKLILNVESKNTEEKTTTATVFYRLNSPSKGEITQLIGTIIIPVGETLEKEYYKRYREKKHKRFELLRKHAIFQMRILTFAEIILNTYLKLKPLCGVYKPPKDLIETKAHNETDQQKMQCTILAMEHIKSAVNGLIIQTCAIESMKKAAAKKDNLKEKEQLYQTARDLLKGLQDDLNLQQKYIQINKEYEGI